MLLFSVLVCSIHGYVHMHLHLYASRHNLPAKIMDIPRAARLSRQLRQSQMLSAAPRQVVAENMHMVPEPMYVFVTCTQKVYCRRCTGEYRMLVYISIHAHPLHTLIITSGSHLGLLARIRTCNIKRKSTSTGGSQSGAAMIGVMGVLQKAVGRLPRYTDKCQRAHAMYVHMFVSNIRLAQV